MEDFTEYTREGLDELQAILKLKLMFCFTGGLLIGPEQEERIEKTREVWNEYFSLGRYRNEN